MSTDKGPAIIARLRGAAASAAGRGVTFHTSPDDAEQLSYSDLDADARARAAAWRAEGLRPGDIAVLAFEPGLPFIRALVACLYAGVTAAPTPITATRSPEAALTRLDAIIHDSGASAVLANAGALRALGVEDDGGPLGIPLIIVDGPADGDPDAWEPPERAESDLAILQYTSGSTGLPKGVMISYGNLLANQLAMHDVSQMSATSVCVGWLPHYHDMGLIGLILQPLYHGAQLILTSPSQFLRRPLLWLTLLSRNRATHTVGPDFAFALCTRLATDEQITDLDLSALETVITGAEPVRITTLDQFTERFSAAGFRGEAFVPAFGMAETTLLVSAHRSATPPTAVTVSAVGLELGEVRPPTEEERPVDLVLCGAPARDTEIVMVDPDRRVPVGIGAVGEIWVRGASVAQGYWNRPDATLEEFGATMMGDDRPFFRTGDLGTMIDGEVVITGRLKDLIIIRGRNIYPQDLEQLAASAFPRGAVAAAFELPDTAQEAAIVVEADLGDTDDAAEIVALIRRRVRDEFGLPGAGVVLIRKGSLPRTTSGKVQRSLTRSLLTANRMPVLHADGIEVPRTVDA